MTGPSAPIQFDPHLERCHLAKQARARDDLFLVVQIFSCSSIWFLVSHGWLSQW